MPDGSTTVYNYDGAGRLISEVNSKSGRKDYKYAWLDKVVEMNKFSASASGRTEDTVYKYYADGQLSDQITTGVGSESFYWDGLALLRRDDTNLTNEPAVTGGNPIMADGKVLFNDMLGSTVGSMEKGKYIPSNLNLFGKRLDSGAINKYTYFTGKPYVKGLGYSFLFRNYREDLSKWQTSDPLGYPDGWNNFAYCNNWVSGCIDYLGGFIIIEGSQEFIGSTNSALTQMQSTPTGLAIYNQIMNSSHAHVITESTNGSSIGFSNISAAWGNVPGGSGTNIYWDTNETQVDGWTAPSWLMLVHELVHASDSDIGQLGDYVDSSGIMWEAEVDACREANRILLESDPDAQTRTTYFGNALPNSAINPE